MLADRVRMGSGVNGIFPPYIYKDGKFGLDITQTTFPVNSGFGNTDDYFYLISPKSIVLAATQDLIDFTNYNTVSIICDIGDGTEWLGIEVVTIDVSASVGEWYLLFSIEPFSQGSIRFTSYLSESRTGAYQYGDPIGIRQVYSKYYTQEHLRVYEVVLS